MALLNLFKLEKLRIEAYTDEGRKKPATPPGMTMMFNPSTYKKSYKIAFGSIQGLNKPGRKASYASTPPGDISFQFLLDGTGVSYMGAEALSRALKGESVLKDIEKFEKLCLKMNGQIHQPNFLRIHWGNLDFPARLASLNISYDLFDQGGEPLRARLDASFIEDKTEATIARESNKSSPDLTHVRIVKSGDTLPLLCKEIYGSSEHYLRVARGNGLDDFRNLVPGQRLSFPPLDGADGAS